MKEIILGVEEKYERRESSKGSVLVLESYFTVGEGNGFGLVGGGASESELLVDEKVIRARFCLEDD